jgi:hybrid cluster-associated redox disulfide protein
MVIKKKKIRALPKKPKTKQKVTKDILMGELISTYPQSSEILMKYGFHCIGCMISPYESLEAGAAVHGIPLEKVLKEINESISK